MCIHFRLFVVLSGGSFQDFRDNHHYCLVLDKIFNEYIEVPNTHPEQ